MSRWKATLRVSRDSLRLLVTDQHDNDVLKARFEVRSPHHRSLPTLLEGLALWSGGPISVAVSADASAPRSYVSDLFGTPLWPESSALVRFDFGSDRRPRRLRGPCSFRDVYLLHGRVAR